MQRFFFIVLMLYVGVRIFGTGLIAAEKDSVVTSVDSTSRQIHFGTDVVPILTKLGCNGGGCHGKATGQNGFKISLFGFEPTEDYEALVQEGRGRRIATSDPEGSLLLLKATGRMPHGGGRRLDVASDDYQILTTWITQGAVGPHPDDPRLLDIKMLPNAGTLTADGKVQLKVIAEFSDGTFRDVTRQAVYQSNEPSIANVESDGIVSSAGKSGLATIMTRFGEHIATFQAAVPFETDESQLVVKREQLERLGQQIAGNSVDRALFQQWSQLGIIPSPPADDSTFLRRASIDITGTLPSIEETNAFLEDKRSDKRVALIARLLEKPEYSSYFALKWADILQNRGAGYSTSKQRTGTKLFSSWIRDSFAANKPYSQFVTEILTASGSQYENPPALWYRTVRKSPEFVESVAQAFLGIRIQCAQCHHHPTENWSQADYFGLAAVFARLGRKGGFADAEVPTNEIIYLKESGEVRHPRTGKPLQPRPLGGEEFPVDSQIDPRQNLALWMTRPENPFFARTLVNRLWAHFLGRGIVHPIDDARSTNPPSNPALLEALTHEFVSSGFDVKHLIRTITTSYAYGLDSTPIEGNAGDTQTFARFYSRRLTAEVLLDGFSQVLEVPTEFPGVIAGTRAIDLPDENVPAHFLDVFGRPARMSACECERVDAPALTQALELVNSAEIQRKLTAKNGYVYRLAQTSKTPSELARELFLRVLSREPSPEEARSVENFLAGEPDRLEAIQSLMWSLLATNEFLFNH